MSSIPTKQIDGDVVVGRNVFVGGKATVRGSAAIGHNLKVDGWLEAKNIKGVNKGLFATVTALREAYPQPHDGWFAGVSASDKDISDLGLTVQQGKALFRMYVGSGGDWVCEPINKLYEIVADNEQVDNLQEGLSTLLSEHEYLEKRVDGHDTEISGIKTQQTTLGNSIDTLTNAISEERAARMQADTNIRDAVTNEQSARMLADGLLQHDIDSEVSARTRAVEDLQSADASIRSDLGTEASARAGADNELRASIALLRSAVDSLERDLDSSEEGTFAQSVIEDIREAYSKISSLADDLHTTNRDIDDITSDISHLTPLLLASEEEHIRLVEEGKIDPEQMYYTVEEE